VTATGDLWTAWARRRDERAFEALVAPEVPHALSFARRLGCGAADAEDAVQEALARLAALRDDTPATAGVRAWLCREVHTRARSRLRSERRRRGRESAVAVSDERPAGDAAVAVRDEVERALSALDLDDRAAVELRYLHDLDYREIALVLRASEGACRQRVHKAIARLRERLGPEAAAIVAALPLDAARDAATWSRRACAKARRAPTATGGMAMASTTTKAAVVAVLAAILGVAGTLAVQRATPGASSTVDDQVRGDATSTASPADPAAPIDGRRRRRVAESTDASVAAAPADERPAGAAAGVVRTEVVSSTATGFALEQDDVGRRSIAWWAALVQTTDAAKREAAWTEVRRAIGGADRGALLAALRTVGATSDVNLDRVGLRDLLLPHVESPDMPLRLEAWQALVYSGIEPIDVDKLRAQTADEALPSESRVHLLMRLAWALTRAKQPFEGADGAIAIRLLDDPRSAKDAVWALQNARLCDAVVARVLAYARQGVDQTKHAVEMVLRALPDKNRDVVAFLLDRVEAGDLGATDRLSSTIRPEDVAYAGERLRRIFDARTAADARMRLVEQVGRLGDVASRAWLAAVRDDAAQDGSVRAAARSAVDALDRPRR
jgi:RNA polymerase sigma-70 factor, ECF subfamily